MGVVTDADVDYGRIYGPFPSVGNVPPSHFIGLIASDERCVQRRLKVSGEGSGSAWLPYIEPARTEEEQNVEAYMKHGHIYYRTLRIIKAGEEFLVWYSKDFAQLLDMPDIRRAQTEDITLYTCDACGERFRYQYPYVAHVRFRCKVHGCNPSEEISVEVKDSEQVLRNTDGKVNGKRKLGTDDCLSSKRNPSPCTLEENNNLTTPHIKTHPEHVSVVRDVCSAFRKVEKTQTREVDKCHDASTTVTYPLEEPNRSLTTTESDKKDNFIKERIYTNGLLTGTKPFDSRFAGRFGMFVSNWMLPTSSGGGPAYIDPRIYRDTLPVSSADQLSTTTQVGAFCSGGSSLGPGNDMFSKQILMEQLRKVQFPYIQTTNPMVEKLLSTATPTMIQRPVQPISLAQNWCAKCNATFRMTSDLVYHMRSHHKREFDPMKRKREDKLQCNVCKETFKERHHLTRHMTSHA